MDPEKLEQYQLNRLNFILRSFRRFPVNRHPLIERLPVAPLAGIADLEIVPLLRREELADFFCGKQNEFDNQTSFLLSTSGSCGTPLHFRLKKNLLLRRLAPIPYMLRTLGIPPGTPFLRVSFPTTPYYIPLGPYINPLNLEALGALNVVRIIKTAPRVLMGTVSQLTLFVEFIERHGIACRFDAILGASEHLTADRRSYFERTLHGSAFSMYGCTELGYLGQECVLRNGFHVNADWIIAEVVDEAGRRLPDGQTGMIALTSLYHREPPLFRYLVGDLGSFLKGTCPCGLPTKRLVFEGRNADFIYLPDGRKIPLISLSSPLESIAEIRRWRLLQIAPNALEFQALLKQIPESTESFFRKIEYFLRRMLNYYSLDLSISVRIVRRLDLLPSGKQRYLATLAEMN